LSKKYFYPRSSDELISLAGPLNKNFLALEENFRVKISAARGRIEIKGKKNDAEEVLQMFKKHVQDGVINISPAEEKTVNEGGPEPSPSSEMLIATHSGRGIKPRSPRQREYIRAMDRYDLTFAIGPAGTGKTFLAVSYALRLLNRGEIDRVILTRPVVEAGEKLGFLPGDLFDKIHPYLAPLFDAFYFLIGPGIFQRYRKEGIIEIIPLAYMRGRTLDHSFIILDEAQNTTHDQMKMFLTRVGMDSKVVVTGDVTQVDLQRKSDSGLVHAQRLLGKIRGIKFIHFNQHDVVRHPLVKKIILAYMEESDLQ